MNESGANCPSRSPNFFPVLILLIAVAAVSGLGFVWWRSRMAATVDLHTYLKLKADGVIQEVWVEGNQLTATVDPKLLRTLGTEEIRTLRCSLDPTDLSDPVRWNRLVEGIPGTKFHYTAGR